MYVATGHYYCNNQSVDMRMMHPPGVYFCEDAVLKLSPGTFGRALTYLVHMCLGWVSCFFRMPVACTVTIPSHMWSTNDGHDFPYFLWILQFPQGRGVWSTLLSSHSIYCVSRNYPRLKVCICSLMCSLLGYYLYAHH